MTSSGPGDLMGAVGNGCGLPSISVPSGFDADGLPTGIQFMSRAYDENVCIAIAREFPGPHRLAHQTSRGTAPITLVR